MDLEIARSRVRVVPNSWLGCVGLWARCSRNSPNTSGLGNSSVCGPLSRELSRWVGLHMIWIHVRGGREA
jgi:hypothetical protein